MFTHCLKFTYFMSNKKTLYERLSWCPQWILCDLQFRLLKRIGILGKQIYPRIKTIDFLSQSWVRTLFVCLFSFCFAGSHSTRDIPHVFFVSMADKFWQWFMRLWIRFWLDYGAFDLSRGVEGNLIYFIAVHLDIPVGGKWNVFVSFSRWYGNDKGFGLIMFVPLLFYFDGIQCKFFVW